MTTKRDSQASGPSPRRKMPTQKLTAATVAIHQKQALAVDLKLAGLSNQAIADRLGYRDRSAVSKAIGAALDRVEAPRVEELRALHSARIAVGYGVVMEILAGKYPQADDFQTDDPGDDVDRYAAAVEELAELKLKAVDRLGRLLERESKLHGLDAPSKTEVSGDGTITVSFHTALQPTIIDADSRQIGS